MADSQPRKRPTKGRANNRDTKRRYVTYFASLVFASGSWARQQVGCVRQNEPQCGNREISHAGLYL
eukprot:8600377-Pyramimonas_sp.AAC.1